MRNLIILFVIIFTLFSCEKEENTIVPDDNIENPISATNTLNGYSMVDVAKDGTFNLKGVDYDLNTYLTGGNRLKSTNGGWNYKVYFKPFIWGRLKERLNFVFLNFPLDGSHNMLIEEENRHLGRRFDDWDFVTDSYGNTIVVDTVLLNLEGDYEIKTYDPADLRITDYNVDQVTGGGMISYINIDKEFTVDSNKIIVDYKSANYKFDVTVLRIESKERFIEAVVDDIDTVLFFNAYDYFELNDEDVMNGEENCRIEKSLKSYKKIYHLCHDFDLYGGTNHITDSTLACRAW